MTDRNILTLLAGNEKTLVITCLECADNLVRDVPEQIFIFSTLGNLLDEQDRLQRNSIEYYVEREYCTTLVVAGHHPCLATDYVLHGLTNTKSILTLRSDLQRLSLHHQLDFVPFTSKGKMLPGQNIIAQYKRLMRNETFRDRFENRTLKVRVVLLHNDHTGTLLFSNGITMNDAISMN
jgi:carbonic anhydrase